MYVQTDDDGRIFAATANAEYADETYAQFDFPEDFDFDTLSDYRIQDGELVHDPLPVSDAAQRAEKDKKIRAQVERAATLFIRESAATMTDAQAVEFDELYEEWSDLIGKTVTKGQIIRHDGELYRIAQDHTAQSQWAPSQAGTESLYTHITKGGDGVDVWQQPTGAHDAYNKGDRVHYPDENGPIYTSTIDGNTWSPDVYPQGWTVDG